MMRAKAEPVFQSFKRHKLVFQQVAEHHIMRAAQQTGDDEGGNRGHEHHGNARDDARPRQWENHPEKHLPFIGPRSSAASI